MSPVKPIQHLNGGPQSTHRHTHTHLIIYDQLDHISARDVVGVGAKILVWRQVSIALVLEQRWSGIGVGVKGDIVDVRETDSGKLDLEIRSVVRDGLYRAALKNYDHGMVPVVADNSTYM
jgi:hypothetical protein